MRRQLFSNDNCLLIRKINSRTEHPSLTLVKMNLKNHENVGEMKISVEGAAIRISTYES